MSTLLRTILIALCAFTLILMTGCGYQIKYAMNPEETPKASKAVPLKIRVAPLSDVREPVEKKKDARDAKGQSDLSDYTYDSEFSGVVADEISKLLVQHLNYTWAFTSPVQIVQVPQKNITDESLTALSQQGVDAVLTGELVHFYGYYDQNLGRQLLYCVPLGVASGLLLNMSFATDEANYVVYWYGPGLVAGYYLESLHDRHIEYRTLLHIQLISTSTKQVIWEEDFDASYSGEKDMPGLNTQDRKFDVAVASLREAANQMIAGLSKNSDVIMQRKDMAVVEREQKERPAVAGQETAPFTMEIMRERGVRFGIVAGVNFSRETGYEFGESKFKTGFCAGGRVSYRFGDNFGAAAEISYSTKGQKYEITDVSPSGTSTAYVNGNTDFSYIDIPIMGKFYPTEDLSLIAGPVLSFYTGGTYELDVKFVGAVSGEYHDAGDIPDGNIKGTDMGILFGAGYSIDIADIETRYVLSLTKYSTSGTSNQKHSVLQFVVGVHF